MRLDPLALSAAGRPVLLAGEVERLLLARVDVHLPPGATLGAGRQEVSQLHQGRLVLTSHRLLWIDAGAAEPPGASFSLPLAAADNPRRSQALASMAFGAPERVKLSVRLTADGQPTPDERQCVRVEEVKLVSRQPLAPLLEHAKEALAQRGWARTPPPTPPRPLPPEPLPPQPAPASGPLQAGLGPLSLASAGPPADPAAVEQLCVMGFARERAAAALTATGNSGVDNALNWLFEHQNDPLPAAPPAAQPLQPPAGSQPALSAAGAGVAGILRREQALAAQTDSQLEQAFKDLDALMGKAGDMVALAESFRATLAARQAAGGSGEAGGAADGEAAAEEALALDLAALGIASPVTRGTAGAQFHSELARQLADFLAQPLQQAGGMMPLPDVYCLFNRARGTELVSPDDLLAAADLLPRIGARARLRRFASGVLVIQSDSHSDAGVAAALARLVAPPANAPPHTLPPPITASDVASALRVPLAVAREHLTTAEAAGVLCRDDGPEGLRFFHNFFSDIAAC